MATNPKMPQVPREKYPDDHARLQLVKKSRFPWPIVALIAAGVILAAIIWYMPRTPHVRPEPTGAQVPAQPTNSQVQLTNVNMTPAPTGGAFYLEGMINNAGQTAITGVQVQAAFDSASGQALATQTTALQGLTGSADTQVQNFTQQPIQPGQSRPFRAYFDHYPNGWNHEVPQLSVTAVTGTTPNS